MIRFGICLALGFVLLNGCEPTDVGINVLPPEDYLSVKYTDTLSVNTGTVVEDSLLTGKLSRDLLGSYHDPLMGRINAQLFSQFDLPGSNISTGSHPRIDSLILTLSYASYYGDTVTTQDLSVFELSENIQTGIKYYSFSEIPYSPNDLAGTKGTGFSFSPKPSSPALRIPLDTVFAQSILDADPSVFVSNGNFIAFFRGLAVIPRTRVLPAGTGSVLSFDLIKSKLTFYYHTDTDSNLKLSLTIGSTTPRFHHVVRSYDPFTLQQAEVNPAYDQQQSFLEGGAYCRMFFMFKESTIEALRDSGIIVNKAEIILKVDTLLSDPDGMYAPPESLIVTIADENKRDKSLLNSSINKSIFYYNKSDGTYSLTVNDYLQELLSSRRSNYGLLISPYNAGIAVNRTVIGGGTHPTLHPLIKLYYTTLVH